LVLSGLARIATSTAQAGVSVTLNIPPSGSVTPVSGKITGLTGPASNYKGILLISSGDNIDLWWDKSHSRYLNLGVPNPGQAQNAGVVLASDFTFNWDNWASAPAQDGVARAFRFFVMPQSFDMTWPNYQIEGIPIPGDVLAAAIAEGFAVRSGAQLSPVLAQPAGGAPAASPAAAAATPASGAATPASGDGAAAAGGSGSSAADPAGGITNTYPGGSGGGASSASGGSTSGSYSSGGDSGLSKGGVAGLAIFGAIVGIASIATAVVLYRRHRALKATRGGEYQQVEGGGHLGTSTARDPTWGTKMPNLSAEKGSARVTPK